MLRKKNNTSYRGCFAFLHKPCLNVERRGNILSEIKVQKEQFYAKLYPVLQETFSTLHFLPETRKQNFLEQMLSDIQGSISKPVLRKLCPFCLKLIQCSNGELFESHLHSAQCVPQTAGECQFKSFTGLVCKSKVANHINVHRKFGELEFNGPLSSEFRLPPKFSLVNKSVILTNDYIRIITAFCAEFSDYDIRAMLCQCDLAAVCGCNKKWRQILKPTFKGTSIEFRNSFESEKPLILINVSFVFKSETSMFLSDCRPINQCIRIILFSKPEPEPNLDWLLKIKQKTNFKRLKVHFDL